MGFLPAILFNTDRFLLSEGQGGGAESPPPCAPLAPWGTRCKNYGSLINRPHSLSPFTCIPGPITFMDGLVGAATPDLRYIITTPNVDFVPTFNQGVVTIQYHHDHRFGLEDPVLHPQIYSAQFPHFPFIRQRPDDPEHRHQLLWTNLEDKDVVNVHGICVSHLAFINSDLRLQMSLFVDDMNRQVGNYLEDSSPGKTRLHFACAAMNAAFARLGYAATLPDLQRQFVSVQRYYLECEAWLAWKAKEQETVLQPIPQSALQYIGAYTTQPAIAQLLMEARVPVWLFRRNEEIHSEVVIHEIVEPKPPVHIDTTRPHQPLWKGYPGRESLAATCLGGYTYFNVERVPFTRELIPRSEAHPPLSSEAPGAARVPDYAAAPFPIQSTPSSPGPRKRSLPGQYSLQPPIL